MLQIHVISNYIHYKLLAIISEHKTEHVFEHDFLVKRF